MGEIGSACWPVAATLGLENFLLPTHTMPSVKFVSPVARSATDDELRWINHDKEGWLKRGCPAISAFKLTGNRFMKAPHDISAETSTEAYKHMGPGYYDI